jgi:site-specific recombinase XerD
MGIPNPRTGDAYRVSSLSKVWKRIREKANLPDTLKLKNATRTSRGSQAANAGISQKTIQTLLGHSCFSSTEKYTFVNLESQRIVLENYSLKKPTVSILSLKGKTNI